MNPRENSIRQHLKMLDHRLLDLKIYQFKKKKILLAKIEELKDELSKLLDDKD